MQKGFNVSQLKFCYLLTQSERTNTNSSHHIEFWCYSSLPFQLVNIRRLSYIGSIIIQFDHPFNLIQPCLKQSKISDSIKTKMTPYSKSRDCFKGLLFEWSKMNLEPVQAYILWLSHLVPKAVVLCQLSTKYETAESPRSKPSFPKRNQINQIKVQKQENINYDA